MDNKTVSIKKMPFLLKNQKNNILCAILIIFTDVFGLLSVESIWRTSIIDPNQFIS